MQHDTTSGTDTDTDTEQDTSEGADAIQAAMTLHGQPDRLQAFYAKWANTYDRDVRLEQYIAPEYMARYLTLQLDLDAVTAERSASDLRILDAGCGTGLVGVALRAQHYTHIDGLDLSHVMAAKARETGAYTRVTGGHDLTKAFTPVIEERYDVTICCGVFTTGHAPPEALEQLVHLTRPGGLLLVSARKSYCEATGFERVCERLQAADDLRLRDRSNGPYLAEEGAVYLSFEVR